MLLRKRASPSGLSANQNGQKKPRKVRRDPFAMMIRDANQLVLNLLDLKDLQNKHGVSRLWQEEIDVNIRARAERAPRQLTIRVVFPEFKGEERETLFTPSLFFCENIAESATALEVEKLPEVNGKLFTVTSKQFIKASFVGFINEYFADKTESLTIYLDADKKSKVVFVIAQKIATLLRSFKVGRCFVFKKASVCLASHRHRESLFGTHCS